MENLIKVSTLREQLSNRTSGIKEKSGIYCWWFKREAAQTLLSKLPLTKEELAKIQERDIENESYLALYFGISKDMLARAKWHTLQKHSPSAVKHGTVTKKLPSSFLVIYPSCIAFATAFLSSENPL